MGYQLGCPYCDVWIETVFPAYEAWKECPYCGGPLTRMDTLGGEQHVNKEATCVRR